MTNVILMVFILALGMMPRELALLVSRSESPAVFRRPGDGAGTHHHQTSDSVIRHHCWAGNIGDLTAGGGHISV